MPEHIHDQMICETHLRSLLKGLTAKIMEVTLDVLILDGLITMFYVNSIMKTPENLLFILATGALVIEGVCFCFGFLNERLWNKIQWGRKVECSKCQKEKKGLNHNARKK